VAQTSPLSGAHRTGSRRRHGGGQVSPTVYQCRSDDIDQKRQTIRARRGVHVHHCEKAYCGRRRLGRACHPGRWFRQALVVTLPREHAQAVRTVAASSPPFSRPWCAPPIATYSREKNWIVLLPSSIAGACPSHSCRVLLRNTPHLATPAPLSLQAAAPQSRRRRRPLECQRPPRRAYVPGSTQRRPPFIASVASPVAQEIIQGLLTKDDNHSLTDPHPYPSTGLNSSAANRFNLFGAHPGRITASYSRKTLSNSSVTLWRVLSNEIAQIAPIIVVLYAPRGWYSPSKLE
jgi:hypothetical protein